MILTRELAGSFVRMALANIAREYPAKLDHFINGPADIQAPSVLHPLFYGSFDWHSCVHSHWMLARLLRLFPGADFAESIRKLFAQRLTAANVAGELAYLRQENRSSFVRTYGWAWLLKLAEELELASLAVPATSHAHAALRVGTTDFGSAASIESIAAAGWRDTLRPLTDAFVRLFVDYLPNARVPLRYGLHPNSAFGLAFASDYSSTVIAAHGAAYDGASGGRGPPPDNSAKARLDACRTLRELCHQKAREWFTADVDYPGWLEPSGNEFLSPALIEADLMRRVLDRASFSAWLQRFLPDLVARQPSALFRPAEAADRTDPQMVHLDGLNLSRAWCLSGIAEALADSDPRRRVLSESAELHLRAGLPTVNSGHYMGEHWLATFAVRALTHSLQ